MYQISTKVVSDSHNAFIISIFSSVVCCEMALNNSAITQTAFDVNLVNLIMNLKNFCENNEFMKPRKLIKIA